MSTTKQIDQIGLNIQSTTINLNDKIDDVRSRLLLSEGQTRINKNTTDDNKSLIALIIAGVSMLITLGIHVLQK